MKRRTDITVAPLDNGITRLNEYDFVNCFLVEGEERACLIDAGAGVADMAAVVRSLTDKPLTVLITHAHADHVGGAVWFREAYIHPLDLKSGYDCMRAYQRAYFLYSHQYKRKTHNVPYSAALQRDFRTKLHTLNEGDVFDLGGRTIETYFTPGHTHGSVSFRDSLTGALFTGDNVNPMVTLHFPRADSVKVWLDGAKKTLGLLSPGALLHVGHGEMPLDAEAVKTLIGWGEEILAAGNKTPNKTVTKRGEVKFPCIVYKSGKVI